MNLLRYARNLSRPFSFFSSFARVCPLWPAASERQTLPYGKGNFRPVGGNETSRLGNLSRRKRHCSLLPAGILIVHRNPCYASRHDSTLDQATTSLPQSIKAEKRRTRRINCADIYYRSLEDVSNIARTSHRGNDSCGS